MNQADILAEKVLDDILEETVLEMQRWVLLCNYIKVESFSFEKVWVCVILSVLFSLYLTSCLTKEGRTWE